MSRSKKPTGNKAGAEMFGTDPEAAAAEQADETKPTTAETPAEPPNPGADVFGVDPGAATPSGPVTTPTAPPPQNVERGQPCPWTADCSGRVTIYHMFRKTVNDEHGQPIRRDTYRYHKCTRCNATAGGASVSSQSLVSMPELMSRATKNL